MKKEAIIVGELRSDLWAIELDDALFAETNFGRRSEAIDFLDFHIIDRISGLLAQGGKDELGLLREWAERIKGELEKIDRRLFERVREEIAAGARRGSVFEEMIRGLLPETTAAHDAEVTDDAGTTDDAGAAHDAKMADERGYDVLDAFVNELFSDRPLPEKTMDLMPDMVSFHKTPVRVVFELIRMAGMDSADVFFDIGSGLGQVVLLVNLVTGAKARGIEYEPAYCEYAGAVASRLRLTGTEFINADALQEDYSTGTVFFLYTPFEGRMLLDMLRRLQQASRDRMIRIFTYGPCSQRVAAEQWLRCVNGMPVDPYSLYLFTSGSTGPH